MNLLLLCSISWAFVSALFFLGILSSGQYLAGCFIGLLPPYFYFICKWPSHLKENYPDRWREIQGITNKQYFQEVFFSRIVDRRYTFFRVGFFMTGGGMIASVVLAILKTAFE
jgi:hypothetical protein